MPFGFTVLGQAEEAGVRFAFLAWIDWTPLYHAFIILCVVGTLALIVLIVGMWKTFEKANQPGWGCIVPIYNIILLMRIAGKPLWWLILLIIPLINLIPFILISSAVAKNFRQGAEFGIGLLFLPFIFYPILGFGDAEFDPDVLVF